MRRVLWPFAALLPLLAVSCDGEVGGTAPSPAVLPEPQVTVSFTEGAIAVAEGDTVEIAVRYQVNELASPLFLTVSLLDESTTPEDYELSAVSFEIPAGRGTNGTAALSLTALLDEQIAEGDEQMTLRLDQPQGVRARLDQNLEVTISDTGGFPCSGVAVVGEPPAEDRETRRWRIWGTTLEILVSDEATDKILFDWESPYYRDEHDWWIGLPSEFDATVAEWEVESVQDATRHAVRVEWERRRVLRLRFLAPEGACDPHRDRLECSADGCTLKGFS